MPISSVHLTHWKRFTDLTIRSLGDRVRLVVLAGPNGSGNSSLFDAFLWQRVQVTGWSDDHAYYWKGTASELGTFQRVTLNFFGGPLAQTAVASAFYFRTAYRNDPEFYLVAIQRHPSCSARLTMRPKDRWTGVSGYR